jgi:hypothetical protein
MVNYGTMKLPVTTIILMHHGGMLMLIVPTATILLLTLQGLLYALQRKTVIYISSVVVLQRKHIMPMTNRA